MFSLAAAAAGCSPSASDAPPEATQLTVGFAEGNVAGAELGVGQFANLLSFESLTNSNLADGRVIARLAERWAWEDSDRTLRVFLRPDVRLHDGRPFRGETAAEIIRRAITSRDNLDKYPALNDISAIRADRELELVIELTRPSAMLPEDLTVPLDVGPDPVGTGPYRVAQRGEDIVLHRFDQYYLGRPAIDRVVVRSFDQIRTTWASLLRGEVDMVYDVPADAVDFISNDDIQVVQARRWYQYAIVFNSQKGPFRSPLVRRALNLAVNRPSLIDKVLRQHGTPSTGPVWPTYWAHDDSVGEYSYEPAQAAALLDQAGFPTRPASGSPTAPPARFRFTCLIPDKLSVWERIALEVQRDLFDVGVDMQFKVVPVEDFGRLLSEGNFDATLLDLISGPSPGRGYIFWRSARKGRGTYNVFNYENPQAEHLFDTLRASTNDAAVRTATRRLQRVMLDDPPALFIAWNERARAIRREFVIPDDAGPDLMWTLWQWTRSPRQVASTQ